MVDGNDQVLHVGRTFRFATHTAILLGMCAFTPDCPFQRQGRSLALRFVGQTFRFATRPALSLGFA